MVRAQREGKATESDLQAAVNLARSRSPIAEPLQKFTGLKENSHSTTLSMATHNIVVFGGDHCGPEVSLFKLKIASQILKYTLLT
jgi:hypothetical protein